MVCKCNFPPAERAIGRMNGRKVLFATGQGYAGFWKASVTIICGCSYDTEADYEETAYGVLWWGEKHFTDEVITKRTESYPIIIP